MSDFMASAKLAGRKATNSLTDSDQVRLICGHAYMDGYSAQWITDQIKQRCDDMTKARAALRRRIKSWEKEEDIEGDVKAVVTRLQRAIALLG